MSIEAFFSALIGAAIAILSRAAYLRYSNIKSARHISFALLEEMGKTIFYPSEQPNFVHFSKQTFDHFFREISVSLPESLVRDIMKYHWRMDYMENHKSITMCSSGGVSREYFEECKNLNDSLLKRLKNYTSKKLSTLFFCNRE